MNSIRIKTASGEVIDLAEVRQVATDGVNGRTAINLLDALEAALSVPGKSTEGKRGGFDSGAYQHNCTLKLVRQAAGVIEEDGHDKG